MDWNDVYEPTRRVKRIEDELAIRNLVARFPDAVIERDPSAFRRPRFADGGAHDTAALPTILPVSRG